MKTRGILPWAQSSYSSYKDGRPGGLVAYSILFFSLFGFPLAIDIVVTPFITIYDATFGEKIHSYKTEIMLSGQLLDESGKGISNYELSVDTGDTIITDKNGFFNKKITIKKSEQSVELILMNVVKINSLINSFKNGEITVILNPIRIKYRLQDKNSISKDAVYLTKTISSNNSSFDALIETTKSTEWNSNKIVLTKQELYSEKNRQLTIADEKRVEAERIAGEKRIKAEELAEEKRIKAEELAEERQERKKKNFWTDIQKGNVKSYTEDEIFAFSGSVGSPQAILYQEEGAIVAMRMPILQVISGGFLLGGGGFIFYAKRMTGVIKRNYHDGQLIEFVGRVNGTYSYPTAGGSQKTVTKVDIYAIRPIQY